MQSRNGDGIVESSSDRKIPKGRSVEISLVSRRLCYKLKILKISIDSNSTEE